MALGAQAPLHPNCPAIGQPNSSALHEVYGDVGENRERLLWFIERRGIQLVFTENTAPALGASYGGRIAILPGQSEAGEFSTLVHEVAHEMLHKAERRTTATKTVKETEAEAIAFVVGKAVDLETGSASADYIHLYHGKASLLTVAQSIAYRLVEKRRLP